MKAFRNHILFKVFCCLLALHIFNVSVDMPDANPDSAPEDLTINDQETVVELVLEKCIGIENAIEEHDEPGDESQSFEIIKEFQLFSPAYTNITFHQHCIEFDKQIPEEIIDLPTIVSEIVPPPPKA